MCLKKFRLICLASLVLSVGCAPQLTGGKTEKKKKNGGEVASIDEAGGEVTIKDGTSVSIPPGALAAGSTVTLQPTAEPDEFTQLANINKASTPVEVSAKDAAGKLITSVPTPMTINIPLDSTGLALLDTSVSSLCAILKSYDNSLYVWRRSELTIDEAGASVKFRSKNFGVFQLVYCGKQKMTGFVDAGNTGVTGDPQLILTVTIPSTFTTYGAEKYCYAVFAEDPEATEANSDAVVVAASSIARAATGDTTLKLTVSEEKIDHAKEYFYAITFQGNAVECALVEGEAVPRYHGILYDAAINFPLTADELLSGIEGTFGGDSFAYERVRVQAGAPAGMTAQTTSRGDSICFSLSHETGYTEVTAKLGQDLLLNGLATMDLLVPAGDNPKFHASVGAACGEEPAQNLTLGRPFDVSLTGFNYGETIYLVPLKLGFKPDFQIVASAIAEVGCIDAWSSVAGQNSLQSSFSVSFKATELFDVLLPYADTAGLFSFSGTQPLYDMNMTVVSDNCDTKTAVTLPVAGGNPQNILNKPLNAELIIPD